MSEFVPNGYFVDKNGKKIEVYDASARNSAKKNAEDITALSEENATIKKDIEGLKTPVLEFTETGDPVTVYPVAHTKLDVVSKITGQSTDWPYADELHMRQINSENLVDIAGALGGVGSTTKNGVTATINDNATLTLNGTENGTATTAILTKAWTVAEGTADALHIFPAGTYTIGGKGVVNVGVIPVSGGSNIDKSGTFTMDEPFYLRSVKVFINKAQVYDNRTVPLYFVKGGAELKSDFAYSGKTYIARFSGAVTDGEYNWITGELKDASGNLVETLDGITIHAMDGKNTFVTGIAETTVTGIMPISGGSSAGTAEEAFDPTAWGMPVLYLDGDSHLMNSSKNEVEHSYVFGEHSGTCGVKWQGNSSMQLGQKVGGKMNYTVKFDTAFEAKEGWGLQSKYVLKSYVGDFTHARDVVCAKMWGKIVKSRGASNPFYNLPNAGAIDGFPVLVVFNGVYHGLFSFNIPKDKWMAGMTGAVQNENIISAESASSDATIFKAPAVLDESDFGFEYVNATDTASIKTRFNLIYSRLASCKSKDDLYNQVGEVLDINSAIDHMVLIALISAHDCIRKNFMMFAPEGNYWYISAYDMDMVFGNHYQGEKYYSAKTMTFELLASISKLYEVILTYDKETLAERYWEIRNNLLDEDSVFLAFADYMLAIPKGIYDKEAKLWPLLPGTSNNDLAQIANFYRMHLGYLDAEVKGWTN